MYFSKLCFLRWFGVDLFARGFHTYTAVARLWAVYDTFWQNADFRLQTELNCFVRMHVWRARFPSDNWTALILPMRCYAYVRCIQYCVKTVQRIVVYYRQMNPSEFRNGVSTVIISYSFRKKYDDRATKWPKIRIECLHSVRRTDASHFVLFHMRTHFVDSIWPGAACARMPIKNGSHSALLWTNFRSNFLKK